MSTKTLRKRIALVAVAGLGFGLLSATTASATNFFAVNANGGSASADSNGLVSGSGNVTGLTATAVLTAGGRVAVTTQTPPSGGGKVRVTGGIISAASGGTITMNTAGTTAENASAAAITVVATPNGGAGTSMVIEYWDTKANYATATADAAVTVTVVASGTINIFAPGATGQKFSAQAAGDTTTYSNSDAVGVTYVTQSVTSALLTAQVVDANSTALTNAVVTATATGGALVAVNSEAATSYLGASSTAVDADGSFYVSVKRATANTAVTTTVSVTVNGVALGSRTFVFVGEAAKVTVSGVAAQATSSTETDSYAYTVTDSAGNLLISKAVTIDSTRYNTSVTSATDGNTAALGGDTATAGWTCSAVKGTASLRVYSLKADGITKVYSNDFTAGCFGDADSYTAALDKASYAPGDIATLTITAKDSAGNPTHDYQELGAGAVIAGSNMTPVTAAVSTDTFTAGVAKYKFIVGSEEGSYQLAVDLSAIDDAVTVAYSIKSSSTAVSNADVLKAIVSLIASINKQIAALQKALLKK
jgi:hypothetical protein